MRTESPESSHSLSAGENATWRIGAHRRKRWFAAQEAHALSTVTLLIRQSVLLLSTLPRHAEALALAASATARAGGETSELKLAVRALSLRAVAEQLRLRVLRALQRAMQRAAPGLLMAACREGLGALARNADLSAVWSQIVEVTRDGEQCWRYVSPVRSDADAHVVVRQGDQRTGGRFSLFRALRYAPDDPRLDGCELPASHLRRPLER